MIWPGMVLQKLTTREPTDEQLEVALASLRAGPASREGREQTPTSTRSRSSWSSSMVTATVAEFPEV